MSISEEVEEVGAETGSRAALENGCVSQDAAAAIRSVEEESVHDNAAISSVKEENVHEDAPGRPAPSASAAFIHADCENTIRTTTAAAELDPDESIPGSDANRR